MNKIKIVFFTCLLCCLPLLNGCTKKTDPIIKSGFYFDTIISITLYDEKYEPLLEHCFELAEMYENYFSATVENSDVSKINASGGAPVSVHDETLELLSDSLYYCRLSNGGFDITIGALSSLWDFESKDSIIPSAEAIQPALATINYENVIINGSLVTLSNPETKLDLGGIAKGYIADKMKAYLIENGVTSGIINLGGNVLSIGEKEDKSYYTIGIQKPFAQDGASLATVKIKDQTVVSSGVYERYFKKDGKLYHHILDPATGYPYDSGLFGVTIICTDSVDGDGLSTTCFSLGLEDGMELIESLPDVEAIFITDENKIHKSSGIGSTIPYEEVK